MAETSTQVLDVQQLLLGSKGDVAQYLLLRPAQGQSLDQRRRLEGLVIELMENPVADGKPLAREEAALIIGVGLWALGRLEEAIASLTAAGSPEADYFLGQCYLESGYFAKAVEAFERAQRAKAATKRLAAYGEAEAMAKGGRPEAALTNARALVRANPDDPTAHYLLGLCLDLTGRYEDAIAAYEKALSLDPNCAAATFRLGSIEALRGDADRALEHYTTLAAAPAVYVNALINLGVLYEDRREYEKAIPCYRQVLRACPNHPRARMFLKDAHAALDMTYDEDRQRELERREKLMAIPISDFEFSVRVRNCLQRIDIETLGDLCRLTEEELLGSRNFGETSLQEIKEVLQARGLRLGEGREELLAPLAASAAGAAAPGVPAGADEAVLAIPIADLNLSMRSRKCMDRLGISTLGQLIDHTPEQLLASRNFGRTSLNEVNEKLARYGLTLKQTPAPEEADEDDDDIAPEEELVRMDSEHEAPDEGE
ncbi:MAG TPA: DNA-directed RNA polymerase subunit alpha C-terminal domain-containing protein [Planctomycetota bacterium]|nr:DNA-directed RNA polymerase subunit alpha C-terminal domain-containing protein [Planctomycetota bacterium]HRR80620.1 DNA-directed RNA polymerase subunit alpha C-terminal domain-containing protein [Planctomycetota bacterium]HRT96078.1 DNA-directed RNA polymerase subunit alpha C-terminal domain-containing protein [Planctomycetota bacterium]